MTIQHTTVLRIRCSEHKPNLTKTTVICELIFENHIIFLSVASLLNPTTFAADATELKLLRFTKLETGTHSNTNNNIDDRKAVKQKYSCRYDTSSLPY